MLSMSLPIIEVVAPSRLHFGMFSFGQPGVRQFGGMGVMVNQPGLRLRLTPAERFEACGPSSARARGVVERIARLRKLDRLPACRIEILSAPPQHVGLGTGTQLALAVTAAINAFQGGGPLEPAALAALAERAERSAIGTYGFVLGGLLVEAGKLAGEALSPLDARIELPGDWRFVLIWPNDEQGLSGEEERAAFRDLPPVPPATTAQLLAEVSNELLPAAGRGQFERFSESLYRFGHQAGMCFAERQQGDFANPWSARVIHAIRDRGVRGAGQSSWGPAVFALVDTPARASDFSATMRACVDSNATVLVAEPNRTGARITRETQA
jgi:beta-ribofuranosylaminobenzene 5'-phosphate synthase